MSGFPEQAQARGLPVFLGAVLLVFGPGSVLADGETVSVSVAGCENLNTDEVRRGLLIELDAVLLASARAPVLEVELACEGAGVRIAAVDPATGKRLERVVPAPSGKGRERVIALAASQLFVASWLELLVPSHSLPAADEVDPSALEAAEAIAAKALGDLWAEGELGIGGGVRLRSLGGILPVAHVELRGGGWPRSGPGLFGHLAFEAGRARRASGSVDTQTLLAGIGIAGRWPIAAWAAFEIGAVLSGGYAHLRGKPSREGITGDAVDGATGELAVSLGPVLLLGDVVLALVIEGGFTMTNPVGRVEGEEPVSVGGFWTGACLRIGLGLD